MNYTYEIIDKKRISSGFLWLNRYQLRHESFRGGWLPAITRERLEGLQAVSVLLFDPARDEIAMIEQFRVGAIESGSGAWLLETIGGYRAPDESAAEVARREVFEEAGCQIRDLMPICEFYVSPGVSSERITLMCARVDASNAGGIHGLPEEGEETRVVVLSVEDARKEMYNRINSTCAIMALQWFFMNKDELLQRWR